jgi:hypothetical protein
MSVRRLRFVHTATRPLDSVTVNLSISESDESAGLGFPVSELQRTLLRLVAIFLGHGARLSLGHDWRDDGVMESVWTFVERYRPTEKSGRNEALITNLLPWPDRTRLKPKDLKALRPSLRVETVGLPDWVSVRSAKTPSYAKTIRVIALTHLRLRLTEISDARICIGGRVTDFQGLYPGIVEEALLSIHARKPLYLVGLLGGAAGLLIDTLLGRKAAARRLSAIGAARTETLPTLLRVPEPYAYAGRGKEYVGSTLRRLGIEGLSTLNGLSRSENQKLFRVETIDEALEIILTGIQRVKRN